MSFRRGSYKLRSLTFINNIPNIVGTHAQRAFIFNTHTLIIPEGSYTWKELYEQIRALAREQDTNLSVTFDEKTKTMTYTSTTSMTITVHDTILQEIMGITSLTGTTVTSGYMNIVPYPYIGVRIAKFQNTYFTPDNPDDNHVIHIPAPVGVEFGGAVTYDEPIVMNCQGTSDLSLTFVSRGRTFSVPYSVLYLDPLDQ